MELSQVTGVRNESYAECRKEERRCGAGACVGIFTAPLHSEFEQVSSAVSLSIREGFKSHRQRTQRVDTV